MTSLRTPYLIALGIFVVDQVSKWIMIGPLALQARGQIVLLPIFNFTWTENRGISLGLAQATNRYAALAAGGGDRCNRTARRLVDPPRGSKAATSSRLALVLGGALGNIVDRVRLGLCGRLPRPAFRRVPSLFCL